MIDLNDLSYFAGVVTHGGFGPASRAMNIPKSKLSRRVAQLEVRLGVRLIERTTRRFRVTEVGRAYFERCRAVITEAEAGEALIAQSHGEPRGLVRFGCAPGLLHTLAVILPGFLERHPGVRLHLVPGNAFEDPIEQRLDLALRVRVSPEPDASLTMRTLSRGTRFLVASPLLAASVPADAALDVLSNLPTLSFFGVDGVDSWALFGPDGGQRNVTVAPRMTCADIPTLKQAATDGMGIALLPDHACDRDLRAGRLVRVLPAWETAPSTTYLVFPARHGLPPAVRALIDHLASAFAAEAASAGPRPDRI